MQHPRIIAALYDWPVWDYCSNRPDERGARDHSQDFNPAAIGHDEYNRKTAAYYRSVTRLKQRGLLTNKCSAGFLWRSKGLWITD